MMRPRKIANLTAAIRRCAQKVSTCAGRIVVYRVTAARLLTAQRGNAMTPPPRCVAATPRRHRRAKPARVAAPTVAPKAADSNAARQETHAPAAHASPAAPHAAPSHVNRIALACTSATATGKISSPKQPCAWAVASLMGLSPSTVKQSVHLRQPWHAPPAVSCTATQPAAATWVVYNPHASAQSQCPARW